MNRENLVAADRFHALFTKIGLGGNGPSVVVKDCIDVAGFPTRAGSAALDDVPLASSHAEVVRALLDDGWYIAAKTHMHELAFGMTGINQRFGTPINPADPALIPGGSSSGSAVAVGSGLVGVAIGSDTGGSIRVPAACCGVLGMKPTFGRVSRRGARPSESSLDCIGPFAASMAVLTAAMATIASGFETSAAEASAHDARVCVVETEADPDVVEAIRSAVTMAGWRSRSCSANGMRAAFDAGLTLINAETYAAFGHLIASGRLGTDVEQRLKAAANTSRREVADAESVRDTFRSEIDALLADADAIVLPTLPHAVPTLEAIRGGASVISMSSLVRPFNVSGHPALSIPLTHLPRRPPVSLQIVGRHGDDERVCALGAHLERILADVGRLRPTLTHTPGHTI
jgi:amidase